MRDRRRVDQGSMTVLVVLVALALTASIALALIPVLVDLTDRQQARSAADAAALAGVTGGRAASIDLAERNHAALISWVRVGHEVTVRVRVGDQEVTARATNGP